MKKVVALESGVDNHAQKLQPLFEEKKPSKRMKFVSIFKASTGGSHEYGRVELKNVFEASTSGSHENAGVELENGVREDNESYFGYNITAQKESEISADEVDNEEKQLGYENAVSFFNKVKRRFEHQNSVYEAFLCVLHRYNRSQEGSMSLSSLTEKVAQIFYGHEDLVEQFKLFLPVSSEASYAKDSQEDEKVYEKGYFHKVKHYFGKTEKYLLFLNFLHCYAIGAIEKTDLRHKIAQLLGNETYLLKDFDDFFNHCENDLTEKKKSWSNNKDKYIEKSIQELDLANSKKCTPSYWKLPKDYSIPEGSNRTELCSKVLNDKWVCRPADLRQSFKTKHKNKHDRKLFECEDDKYEADMLIEYFRSCINSAERVLKKGNEYLEEPIQKDDFTVQNLRTIERLYGEDNGFEVVKLFGKTPRGIILPLILKRLKEREMKLVEDRSNDEHIWSKAFAENHHKSLNNRGDST